MSPCCLTNRDVGGNGIELFINCKTVYRKLDNLLKPNSSSVHTRTRHCFTLAD